ncbi:MAG: sugar phosphate isomerase/epimerase [Gemmatimonadota bacterium]
MDNRREFLGKLAGTLAGLTIAPATLSAATACTAAANPRNGTRAGTVAGTAGATKLARVGIQLYTVRRDFTADPAATLAAIAAIGYKDVEFAGYGGKTAVEIRDLLKQHGLGSPSTHIGLNVIMANPAKTFDDAKTIGHQWVTAPSLPSGAKATVDDWKRIADQFNAAGKEAKAAGLRFAFHNHNAEFRKIGDVVPMEVLLANTDPALVDYEMDLYWVVNGGGDPIDLLTRYRGRFRMLHAKDSAGAPDHKMVEVGAGTIDFKSILARATKDGIRNVFVEHDNPPAPMGSARASYTYLSSLEF